MAFIKNKIFILKILLSGICILFLAVTFHSENRSSGWVQQFMPYLNGAYLTDITFTDSLNGYAVSDVGSNGSYLLKTSNGGDNWSVKLNYNQKFTSIDFINTKTGYTSAFTKLFKTTNAGENWDSLVLYDFTISDMAVLNEDTIWVVGCNGFYDAILRTTNRGVSWQEQYGWGSLQDMKLYMYNARIGFATISFPSGIWKTTNGGNNWSMIVSYDNFEDINFVDSLTGWKCSVYGMKKTTDGGLNWVTQQLPTGGYIYESFVNNFMLLNKDTIWAAGGNVLYPPNQFRGILLRSTNGGNNWYYQIPDTSFHIVGYWSMNFVNKLNGWTYRGTNTGIHTIVGGDTTFYSGIQKISNEIPKDYILHQNYPNPFNPRTVIGYEIKKNSFVRLDAYDILGKQVMVLVNEKQSAGKYEVDFMGKFSPSGIYFYRLMADGKVIDTKKMLLVK